MFQTSRRSVLAGLAGSATVTLFPSLAHTSDWLPEHSFSSSINEWIKRFDIQLTAMEKRKIVRALQSNGTIVLNSKSDPRVETFPEKSWLDTGGGMTACYTDCMFIEPLTRVQLAPAPELAHPDPFTFVIPIKANI